MAMQMQCAAYHASPVLKSHTHLKLRSPSRSFPNLLPSSATKFPAISASAASDSDPRWHRLRPAHVASDAAAAATTSLPLIDELEAAVAAVSGSASPAGCDLIYGGGGAAIPVPSAAAASAVPAVPDVAVAVPFVSSQRIKVLALVALAMALCNADRVIMSVAMVRLSSIHHWSPGFTGVVQSSFLWGYVLSPIVGGALVDKYGGKNVMACGLALWSLATLLTPWAANHSMFMLFAMRVLMGLAEGVAMPSMNNMISRWFPRSERAGAVGLSMAGFHLGIVLGLLATPVLMNRFGIDMPFMLFGLAGAVWMYFWLSIVSNDPQTHPSIGVAERRYLLQNSPVLSKGSSKHVSTEKAFSLPIGVFLKKLPSMALILANFMNNWGYFVLLSWMPVYFSTVYGVNLKQAAWYSALPWTMMAALGCLAGKCSDYLIEAGVNVTTVRKMMQSIGFIGPALSLLGLNASPDANTAAILMTAAVGTSAFSQAGFLVNFQEVAPSHAGLLHGMANTVGTMGAIISTIGIGYFTQWLGSFQAFLTLTAAMYVASALFWNLFASGERIFD